MSNVITSESPVIALPTCLTHGPSYHHGERGWCPLRVVPGTLFKDVIRCMFDGAAGDSDRPKGYVYLGKSCASEQMGQSIDNITQELHALHAGGWPQAYVKPAPWLLSVWDAYLLGTDMNGIVVSGNDESFSVSIKGNWSDSYTVERTILRVKHSNLTVTK